MKKSVLLLVIVLASITVGSAFAITIRLAGDVTVDGTLTTGGAITSPTITSLQSQIDAVAGPVSPDADGDTLQGIDSTGFVQSLQSCTAGQLVIGFDSSGDEICSQISHVRDTSTVIDSGAASDIYAMTIGSDGFPIIIYETFPNLTLIHCTNVSCSSFDSPFDLVTGNVGFQLGITIGNDGFPAVVHRENTGGALVLTHCLNVSCTSADTSETIEAGPIFGGLAVTTASNGFPIVVYDTQNSGVIADMKIIHCLNASCSSRAGPTIFDTVTNPFKWSIAIGNDNLPVISYNDASTFDFLVTHCNTNICDDVVTTTAVVDEVSGTIGNINSIAIGTDGNPILAYKHSTGANFDSLNIVHCTNATCTSSDSPLSLDNGGPGTFTDVARRISMVIDNDGNPVIEYGHGNLDQIRIIQCTSTDCSTFDPPVIIDNGGSLETDSGAIAVPSDGFPLVAFNDGSVSVLFRIGGLSVP